MPASRNRQLTPEEEIRYLLEIYDNSRDKTLNHVLENFTILQGRAQMLISLITICLTVTGFSGPTIAASSHFSRYTMIMGLIFVLVSAIVTLLGPLQLRWATQWRCEDIQQSLANLIRRRNQRTRRYHAAFLLLIIGLSGYCASVVGYMLQLP